MTNEQFLCWPVEWNQEENGVPELNKTMLLSSGYGGRFLLPNKWKYIQTRKLSTDILPMITVTLMHMKHAAFVLTN